jgi:hypothetical protein
MARFIETFDHDNGTIHRRQVFKEEDLVETAHRFIAT